MMFSGGKFSSNDVTRAILAPALLRATSNIFTRLFSDVKLAPNCFKCSKTQSKGTGASVVPLIEYAQLIETLADCELIFKMAGDKHNPR